MICLTSSSTQDAYGPEKGAAKKRETSWLAKRKAAGSAADDAPSGASEAFIVVVVVVVAVEVESGGVFTHLHREIPWIRDVNVDGGVLCLFLPLVGVAPFVAALSPLPLSC